MARTREIVGAGISPLAASNITGSETTGATAAGTTQANAYAIGSAMVEFTTLAASTGAVLPTGSDLGDTFYIWNGGASTLTLYPPGTDTVNNGSTSFAIATMKSCIIWKTTN